MTHRAVFVVQQQLLGARAMRVITLCVCAFQDVLPQQFAELALALELAVCLVLLALGAVSEE